MTMQSEAILVDPVEQPADFITVNRIELFVLPSALHEPSDYRLCLRLTTDQGIGWSELFIDKSEKPRDWIMWSSVLLRFIGTFYVGTPVLFKPVSMIKDVRVFYLFAAATLSLTDTRSSCLTSKYDWNEAVLFKQATSYISLF
ncbi:hypothetical protein [Paenibacillus sp. PL91]|uniref:hypothetical protein n=1 Tax=Paenibacillus sp. PL91 TaxID=2729538 RepID=UPI00145FC3E8|nr:hypothetical protein [Paenibacillus sp. PL91]MBC9203105.1 hypothetical protein [Paenibacillus sp. PL91]